MKNGADIRKTERIRQINTISVMAVCGAEMQYNLPPHRKTFDFFFFPFSFSFLFFKNAYEDPLYHISTSPFWQLQYRFEHGSYFVPAAPPPPPPPHLPPFLPSLPPPLLLLPPILSPFLQGCYVSPWSLRWHEDARLDNSPTCCVHLSCTQMKWLWLHKALAQLFRRANLYAFRVIYHAETVQIMLYAFVLWLLRLKTNQICGCRGWEPTCKQRVRKLDAGAVIPKISYIKPVLK